MMRTRLAEGLDGRGDDVPLHPQVKALARRARPGRRSAHGELSPVDARDAVQGPHRLRPARGGRPGRRPRWCPGPSTCRSACTRPADGHRGRRAAPPLAPRRRVGDRRPRHRRRHRPRAGQPLGRRRRVGRLPPGAGAPRARPPSTTALVALTWAVENAELLGVDASRSRSVATRRAGTSPPLLCLRVRDEFGPDIDFQLLVYPVTDCTLSHPSMDENAEGYFLTKDTMVWFVGHYLGGASTRRTRRCHRSTPTRSRASRRRW